MGPRALGEGKSVSSGVVFLVLEVVVLVAVVTVRLDACVAHAVTCSAGLLLFLSLPASADHALLLGCYTVVAKV